MTAEEFCRLTSPLWKWMLDNGEHWTAGQVAQWVAAMRVAFITSGGVL